MADSWDDYASTWDDNQDVRLYRDKALATLRQVSNIAGKRILDFGCGTGLLTQSLASEAKHITAIDSSEAMIEVLKSKQLNNVTALSLLLQPQHLASVAELAEPFDLILASSVCGFLPDYPATLSLLTKLLKPEGQFVQWDWQGQERVADSGFVPAEIESAFSQAGLQASKIETGFSLGDSKVIMAVGIKTQAEAS